MFRDSSRSRLTLLALVAAAVVLLALDGRPGSDPVTGTARAGAELAFAPVAGGVGHVADPVTGLYQGIKEGPEAADRIAELEEANAELESELEAAALDEDRADQLDDLLHLSGLGEYEIVPARAITHVTSQGYAHTATLDAGTRSGVEKNMTVVNGQGLVGKVTEAGPRTSTVLLTTDHNSSVGARLEGSGKIGVAGGGKVPGAPEADLTYELFDMETQIEPGDRIVTLGSHDGAPFVPGVPIGTVEEVHVSPGALSRVASIEPAVDHASLDTVGVVVDSPAGDPRDSLLPPKPDREEDR
ncbi:rod shape-determining protein MreC [Nocardiopsis sp. HNM0947]|uniref:Cell shape-determining protein MreC n=1 Tax=Nocardiopsis coralli TaxID=2772213 RepID=A0ABR9P430_9ACTN|nr:rod shape-determining protein MreC [Nocardiopsis coralli]MBE2998490.1 rod shape-determining protein MreC [Nocardiopsis coralli]